MSKKDIDKKIEAAVDKIMLHHQGKSPEKDLSYSLLVSDLVCLHITKRRSENHE